MLTRFFQMVSITFCGLFAFSACQTGKTDSSLSVLPTPLPIENSVSVEETSNVWDVSDIDISEIDRNRKLIAVTFDDAPSSQLENILAVFADFNEKNPDCKAFATVFCNGNLCNENNLNTLYAASALGFELGNHSHSHFDLTTLSKKELEEEIDKTDEILEKIDGKKRHLFRAPFGRLNELVKETAQTPLIDWTIDTLDWTGISEEEIFEKVFSNKTNGHIVLMHDAKEYTVSALKSILPSLKEAGYQVVSVSQLAKAHDCVLKRGKVYIRLRKQS